MYLPPLRLLLLLLRLLRPLSPSDRDIDAARLGQSIGCGVEFSSFKPTTFRGKFHIYANAVYRDLPGVTPLGGFLGRASEYRNSTSDTPKPRESMNNKPAD